MLPVTSHRSVQKLDVWHRSNPRADSCLFTPLRRAVHGIMPRINFLKTTGTGDLGRGRRGGGGGGGGGVGAHFSCFGRHCTKHCWSSRPRALVARVSCI